MRPIGSLTCLLLTALLIVPVALADGEGRSRAEEARADHAPHADDAADEARANNTDRPTREARAHPWADANATADHSARVEAFIAEVRAMHTSWKENATSVRDLCQAQQIDKENATKEQRGDFAHCIRDGYAEWHAEHRASLKALRDEMRGLFGGWHMGHAKN
jgi:hypothetical protein